MYNGANLINNKPIIFRDIIIVIFWIGLWGLFDHLLDKYYEQDDDTRILFFCLIIIIALILNDVC